jgi:hypothetical protein
MTLTGILASLGIALVALAAVALFILAWRDLE